MTEKSSPQPTPPNDGGPAFPIVAEGHEHVLSIGVTLRDYLAAKAMQGMFTSPLASSGEEKDYIAMHAYRMADAMLKARGVAA